MATLSLSDLAAQIAAAKKARDARTAALAQKNSDLGKRADDLLARSETALDATSHDLDELEAR
jgi:hypothetical protein